MEAGLRQPGSGAPESIAEPQEGGTIRVDQGAVVGTHLEKAVAIERIGATIGEHLHIAFTVM
jgi:hypothetical protein